MIRTPPCYRPKCGRTRPSASTTGRSKLRFPCESTMMCLPGCDRKARDTLAGLTAFCASEWSRRRGTEAAASELRSDAQGGAGGALCHGLFHHDVDQLVGDDDHFDHLLAFEEGLHFFVGEGSGFQFLLRGAEGGVDAAAELAVDLDDDLGFVFLGELGVEGRPGVAEDGTFVTELFPDLLHDIDRKTSCRER